MDVPAARPIARLGEICLRSSRHLVYARVACRRCSCGTACIVVPYLTVALETESRDAPARRGDTLCNVVREKRMRPGYFWIGALFSYDMYAILLLGVRRMWRGALDRCLQQCMLGCSVDIRPMALLSDDVAVNLHIVLLALECMCCRRR